ncbi:MAG: Squalene/phytoene synthase [Polaromonas sp.]|nr:Squalene/phytoene synthase [Polaromonas sp.]
MATSGAHMSGAASGVGHYENFPVASFLCPPALRPPIAAIYWFARTADDIADEGDAPPQSRLDDLAAYRDDLLACAAGQATSPRWAGVFGPLRVAIVRHALPVDLLGDLLSAFAQDVVKTRYADDAELLDYCRRSANPVGRLLLHLYGVQDEDSLVRSDQICSALQLLNFWQDLSVDIPRGRIYIPASRWASHGVTEAQLLAREVTPATTALVEDCVAWGRQLMHQGAPLVKAVPGRAGWELRLVVQGGLRIADKIKALDHGTLARRPRLGAFDAAVMLLRAPFT